MKHTKLVFIIVAAVVLITGIVVATYFIKQDDTVLDASSSINTDRSVSDKKSSKQVTKTGTITCLKPIATIGVQDMSCTLGLEAGENISYALSSDDPLLLGSVPAGQSVRISGKLESTISKYKVLGIINVVSVEKL